MALQFSLVDLPLYGGINEHDEEILVQPGSTLVAENVEVDKVGAFIKRPGFSAITNTTQAGGSLSDIKCASVVSGATSVIDGSSLYTQAGTRWRRASECRVSSIEASELISNDQGVIGCSEFVTNGSICLVAYTTLPDGGANAELYYKIFNFETGVTIANAYIELVQTGAQSLYPVATYCGTTAVILSINSANQARAHTLDLSAAVPTISSFNLGAVPVASRIGGYGISATEVLVCLDSAGGTIMTRRPISTFVPSVTSPALGAGFTLVDFDGDNNTAWQLVDNGVVRALAAFNATTLAVLGGPGLPPGFAGQEANIITAIDANTCYVGGNRTVAFPAGFVGTGGALVYRTYDTTIAALWGAVVVVPYAEAASRVFRYNGELLQWIVVADFAEVDKNGIPSYRSTLCRILEDAVSPTRPPTILGALIVSRGTAARYTRGTQPDNGIFLFPSISYRRWLPQSGSIAGVDLVKIDFLTTKNHKLVTANNSQHIGSGQGVELFDGTTVVEHGYIHGPDIMELVVNAGVGFAAGVYAYQAVYEWTDDAGNLHRSAPGKSYIWTNPGVNAAPSLAIRNTWATRRQAFLQPGKSLRIVLYRSAVNSTQLYRVASRPNTPTLHVESFIAFPVVGYTYADTTNPEDGYIYTEGGRLEARHPPPSKTVYFVNNRLWLVNGEDNREVWFSQEVGDGLAPEWSPELTVRVDENRGGVTAIAGIDGRVILYTPGGCYVVAGSGPSPTGVGAFSQPQKITNSVGCDSPRTIADTPSGLIFSYNRNLFQLTRGLALETTGEIVKSTLNTYPIVGDSVVLSATSQVFWVCSTEDGSSSIILVYDWRVNIWYTWTTPEPVTAIFADENNNLAWATAPNTWAQNQIGRDYDGSNYSWIQQQVITPWLRVGSYQGWQRVRVAALRGEYLGEHSLQVAIAYDNESFSQTGTWSDAELQALPEFPVLRLEQILGRQRCALVRFRVRDIADGSTDSAIRGSKLIGITLTVGQKPGRQKLSPGRRK